jgi:hypothetical protein
MLKLKRTKLFILIALTIAIGAHAFDIEDYATTYRATRDAYLKSANELKLATGPYVAARKAYVEASLKYLESLESPESIKTTTEAAKARKTCLDEYKVLRQEYYSRFTTYP